MLSVVHFRHLSSLLIVDIKEEAERMASLRELSLAAVKLSEPLHTRSTLDAIQGVVGPLLQSEDYLHLHRRKDRFGIP